MKLVSTSCAVCAAMFALASCSDNSRQVTINDQANQNVAENTASIDSNRVELPPSITRSPAYRCQDGQALYVDVMSEGNAVLVRDSRTDTPVRLEREGGQGSFTGDGRTLSDTDDEVIYASPERASQMCREAQE